MNRELGRPALVDTNLLIYSFRSQSPEHRAARDWLAGTLRSPTGVALTTSAVVGFVRLITHPRTFRDAVRVPEALGFVARVRSAGAVVIEPGGGYPDLFDGLCRSLQLRGDDIPDAHLAALAIEHDAVLATHDRGFDRFPGLRTFDPLA